MIFCFLCRNRQIVIFVIEIIFAFITATTISIIIITTTNIFYVCIMTMLMMLRLMMRKAGGESEKFVSCVEDGLIVSQVTIIRILVINADEDDDKHDHNCCRYFACPAPTGRMFLHKVKFFHQQVYITLISCSNFIPILPKLGALFNLFGKVETSTEQHSQFHRWTEFLSHSAAPRMNFWWISRISSKAKWSTLNS